MSRWPWAQEFISETYYLNTASAGLPPQRTTEVMRAHLDRWGAGRMQAPEFDDVISRCRELYASFMGLNVATVAVGS